MAELIRRGNKFFTQHDITCYETDAQFRLKPAAFMDLSQEIAMGAAAGLGFGYDDLMQSRHAWVLSRMHFHITEAPKWKDRIVLSTWHKGNDGLFFLRDFRMETPDGKPLIECTSSWLIIDIDQRRLLRDPFGTGIIPGGTSDPDEAILERSPKLTVPAGLDLTDAGIRIPSYSDIDILGHTNNARYLVWSMDALDYGTVAKRPVQDVWINFNKEARQGETVAIRTAWDGDSVYVEGRSDGISKYIAKIDF